MVQGIWAGKETWEVVEFFSGKGRISRLAAKAGYPTASFELELDTSFKNKPKKKNWPFSHRSFMDFNGESGYASLYLD